MMMESMKCQKLPICEKGSQGGQGMMLSDEDQKRRRLVMDWREGGVPRIFSWLLLRRNRKRLAAGGAGVCVWVNVQIQTHTYTQGKRDRGQWKRRNDDSEMKKDGHIYDS